MSNVSIEIKPFGIWVIIATIACIALGVTQPIYGATIILAVIAAGVEITKERAK